MSTFTHHEIERVEDALFEADIDADLRGKVIASLRLVGDETITLSPKGAEVEAEVVKRELAAMARNRVEYIRLDPVAVVCEEVVGSLKEAYPNAYFTVTLYSSDITITITNALPDMLTKLLRGLGVQGFHQRREPHTRDDGKARSHYLERGEGENVDINVFWTEDSTDDECKLVQTGTKVINQPIYEMICKDDPRYEELTA